jgi:hypothetical protein
LRKGTLIFLLRYELDIGYLAVIFIYEQVGIAWFPFSIVFREKYLKSTFCPLNKGFRVSIEESSCIIKTDIHKILSKANETIG